MHIEVIGTQLEDLGFDFPPGIIDKRLDFFDNVLNRDEIGIKDLVQNLQATGSYDRRRVLQRQNRVIGDKIQDIFVQLEILRLRQHVCEDLHAEILVLNAEIFDVFKQPELGKAVGHAVFMEDFD